MHAEKCPVCKGTGEDIQNTIEKRSYDSTGVQYVPYQIKETCRGCHGKGWVEVRDIYEYPRYNWGGTGMTVREGSYQNS